MTSRPRTSPSRKAPRRSTRTTSAEHEDDLHGEYGTGAGYDPVTSADAEHETEPDLSAPASTHGDDLTINGQRDATANGSGPGIKPESPASKE